MKDERTNEKAKQIILSLDFIGATRDTRPLVQLGTVL